MQQPIVTVDAPSIGSRVLFSWMTPLVRHCWGAVLQPADVRVAKWATPATVELLDWYDRQEGSFRSRAWKLVRRRLGFSGLLFLVYSATQMAQPLILRQVVLAVQGDDENGFVWCLLIGLCGLGGSICKEHQLFMNFQLGAELRAVTVALVYRHALRKRQAELPTSVSNLLTNDAQKLLDALPLIHQLWATPLIIFVCVGLIIWLASWVALVGILVLCLMIPFNLRLVRRLRQIRSVRLPLSDLRVARCVEMVKGVRVLKFNGWDAQFEASINSLREAELPFIKQELFFYAALMTLTITGPQIATGLSLVCVALASPSAPLTAELAFPVLSLFSVVRFPLMFLGDLVGQLVHASVALRRIDHFLSAEAGLLTDVAKADLCGVGGVDSVSADGMGDLGVGHVGAGDADAGHPGDGGTPCASASLRPFSSSSHSSDPTSRTFRAAIELSGVSVAWTDSSSSATVAATAPKTADTEAPAPHPTAAKSKSIMRSTRCGEGGRTSATVLQDAALCVSRGELLLISGPVGSGKSTLLSSILGEALVESGTLSRPPVDEPIAYCAQVAWIQNLSIRGNILFGRPFDRDRYLLVLSACGLHADLATLAHADQTVIGERGVTVTSSSLEPTKPQPPFSCVHRRC